MKQEICKCEHSKRRHEWTDGCCMNCNCQKYTQVEKPQEEISKGDREISKSSNSSVAQQLQEFYRFYDFEERFTVKDCMDFVKIIQQVKELEIDAEIWKAVANHVRELSKLKYKKQENVLEEFEQELTEYEQKTRCFMPTKDVIDLARKKFGEDEQ